MKIRLGVMFGGASVEHEISILSAMQAMQNLDCEKYTVLPLYVSKDRKIYHDSCLLDLENYKDLNLLCERLTPISIYAKQQRFYIHENKRFFGSDVELDFVLPIMHGTNGEDGSVQGYLKFLGIPFAGSDVIAAAIGQDKAFMKNILAYHKLPITPYFCVHRYHFDLAETLEKAKDIGYPLVAKPANLGSSIGIHQILCKEDMLDALQDAFAYDDKVVLEKMIMPLREFNCSVLGDEHETQTSCIEEVLKEDEILSYHDKYEAGAKSKGMVSTKRILPANLTDEQKTEIEQLAIHSFHTLQASGVVRIDFLMDAQTEQIYVNEINTIPGSLAFYLWKPIGIEFTDLLDHLIELGRARQRHLDQMIFSYDSNVLTTFKQGGKMIK